MNLQLLMPREPPKVVLRGPPQKLLTNESRIFPVVFLSKEIREREREREGVKNTSGSFQVLYNFGQSFDHFVNKAVTFSILYVKTLTFKRKFRSCSYFEVSVFRCQAPILAGDRNVTGSKLN